MVRSEDALELLLPRAGSAQVRHARSVTHFLRLLTDDASPARASSVGIDLERARGELERADRMRIESALLDLLRYHLGAALATDSFAWVGEPNEPLRTAWRTLQDYGDELDWLAGIPAPGEAPASVVARLLDSLERLGIDDATARLWRARVAHVLNGPRAGEKLYRALWSRLGGRASSTGPARACLAGLVECLLERGAVREARTLLQEHGVHGGEDTRLWLLLAWSRLVSGDVTGATIAAAGRGPWTGPLPASLHELRSHKPEWMPCLTGRAPMEPAQPPRAEHVTERGELGASVFGVFAFQPGHTFNALTLDVAPGLKPAVGPWLEDREGATAVRGEREHRLLVGAKPLIEHASDAESLRNVIGRGNTRAVALAPVQDEDGEAIGWLYAEWEHHLVPSAARLTRCAQSWLTAVRRARIAGASGASAAHASALADPAQRERRAAGEVFRDIVEQLAIKTHQRRWWGFVPAHESQEAPIDGDPPLELVAEGGEGNGFVPFEPGRKRALARAYVTGGRVDFDEPDARLSILGDAGSGVVFPLAVEGRLAGLLAIESSRKHDFRSNDLDASTALVAAHGLRLRLARFRAWHAARFGFEPWFDARRSDFQDFARHLIVGARAHNPWVLHGARGAGKLVLARWAHFEGATGGGELVVAPCGELTPARLEDLAQRAAGGTLLLDELELANSEVQRELASWIATRRADPKPSTALRLGCTTRVGLQVAAAEGRLRDDLAGSFANFELRVPALRERREEIPALVEHMLRMQAEREGQRPAKPSDEALALLWRQPWPGNLRELESVVFKLALLHPGELLSVEHVHDLRRHFELELVRRLPSRSPNRADLLAALRTTRKSCGRINKTRAAAYLGWDPDTLVLRMREAGIPDDMPQLESAWAASESSTAVAAAPDTLRGTGSALDATQLESKKKGPPAVFDASGP